MAKTPASIQNLPLFISQILLLAVLYFAAGQASFSLSVSHSIITLVVFAAEGFALSFVILWGKRLWLGVFLGQLVLALYNGLAWQLAFGISIINSLEAVIGAILFHRMAIQAPFAKMRDTLGLLILIFFVLQPFSATLGTLLLWVGNVVPGTQLISSWFSWWFGNSLGQALITPLLLSFFADKNSVKQKLHRVFWLILLVIPISILMLSTQYFPSSIIIVFTVTLLLLVSIAARGGSAMVSLAIVIITVIALSITKRMMGVFIHDGVILLLDLNIYLLGIILIGQLLASLLTEYKQTRLAQQKIAEHLQKISDHFPGMIYTFRMNPDGSYCMPYTSVGIQAIYHLSPEEVQNSAAKVFALIHPEDYDTVVASIEVSAQHLTPWQCDYRIRFENGTVRWLSGHSVPQREENGAILWHGFMKDVTESKQKEIEYQAVIEASFSGFWCVDFSGRFLSVNTALCHILGYSRQELLAMCIGDIEAIETPEDIAARANNIIQTGHDSFESQHRRKDGELIDVAVNVLYVASLGQRFFTFVNDITDSKQAEKKLQENQQKLNVIFDTLGVGISITDEHGNIIDCNKSSESLLGVAKQDHLQRNYAGKEWQIIRADFTPMPAEEFASVRALKDNIPVSNVEMGIVKQHGEITWLLVSATPVGIKGYGVVIAYMDISIRKQSQNALIASEEKYRTLFNSIQDGIVFVDMQGNILDCNQYYCDMLGLGKQEVTQIHFNQITPDEWHDLEADILRQQVMTRGYSDLYEKEYIKKDGTVFPIELRAWLINDKQDNAVGMWAIVRDITERKHIEKTHTFLSQTVRQYTDESFFESLARYLAQCLDMEFVCIDRLEGDGLTAETVAVYHNGSFEDNVSYALKDTPCGDVVGQTVCCFPASVCQFFPKDEVLKTLNAESYIGVTLWGSTGEAIGLIAVIGEKPINNRLLAESILKIVAVRAAGELERNRMEAELRNSHNELLRYFDQPFIGMLTAGHDKKILHVNQRFCDMVGYSKEEMQLIDWGEITHPDDIAHSQAYLDQAIRGCCDAYQMETRYIHKDGHIVYVDLAVYCVRKADGQPDYFIRMMLDITQRKSVERYLQKNQALLQTAQRAARLGHYVTDLKTKTWTNDLLFDEIFGIDRSFNRDFVNWRQLIFPEDRQRVMDYFMQTNRNHELFPSIEYRIVRPCDGLMRWVAVWVHDFYDDNDNPVQQVGMIQDITERKATEEYINNLAFYDPLTQLPNRRLLQERIKHGIEIDHRTGSQIAVLMMDLDKFKAVNDSLGHAAGDELLKQVAERIKSRLREVDTIARLGGDEFVIVMEDVTHDEYIAHVANNVIHVLSQPFMLYQHHEVHIGISIGIAIHPQHGDSVEELMDNADTALYHAKDQGRGCFAYFSETLTQKARERIALEASLRHAIEQQELRVYFQPQVEINSGRLIGAEALVRWYDPVHGCLMPDDFISLAEETGLIVVIGEWVLRETCRLGRQWLDQGLPPLTLSVNISPYQFRRYDINALLTDVLRDTGFPADSLELEVTETGLMENKEHALSILNLLHEQGVHIAIDNFGTGYSSLAALKYFPLDALRIDKTFIDDVPFLEGDIAITATIISMAHNLGFKVLADGVETSEQLAFLRTHHCDHYQGHLYSKALSADEFVQFLKST